MPAVDSLFALNGSVAVVTGGTGVLGSAFCKALAGAGASVVVLGRDLDAAKTVSSDIQRSGGRAMCVQCDVLEQAQLVAARNAVLDEFGSVDILVNAAGGNLAGAIIPPEKNFLDLDVEDLKDVIDLNLVGTVRSTQVFCEPMARQRRGVVVNISSLTASRPLTRVAGYSASKAAVTNFTQWLAVEMANKFGAGIRVNALAPGFFLTEQNRTLLTNADGTLTERGKSIIGHTPFGRFGEPGDLAGTLIWLCSDASKFVSGVVVPVDGGFNAYAGV